MMMMMQYNKVLISLVVFSLANEIDARYQNIRLPGQSLNDFPSGKQALDQIMNTSLGMKQLSKSLRLSETEIQSLFEKDSTLRLNMNWNRDSGYTQPKLFYVEPPSSSQYSDIDAEIDAEMFFDTINIEDAFSLHSRAGSTKTIYLDFTGRNVTGTAWNNYTYIDTIVAPPYDLDNDPSSFSSMEHDAIAKVWRLVSEDFASFDVDVTTEYSGSEDFLIRSNMSDSEYGVRVLITPIPGIVCNWKCAGIAYLDTFKEIGAELFH